MRGLLSMFDRTKMIVLLSVTAGLYASLLIPFKALVIIPGYTEIRPGSVIPVICSLYFGPAAAWGAAFGNLIGDFIGMMLGVSSLFGMAGNFLYGYIPYRVWLQGKDQSLRLSRRSQFARYFVAATSASLACAVSIAWGVDALGQVPFVVLANIITINNLLVTLILGPILLKLLTPRLEAWGLLYQRIMKQEVRPSPRVLHIAGVALIYIGSTISLAYANLQAFGSPAFLARPFTMTVLGHSLSLHMGTTPGVLLVLVGCLLV
jgi:energy-coupling factor transport system substrate-specific component